MSDTISISEDLSNKFDELRVEKEQMQNDAEKAFEVLGELDAYLNRLARGENVELDEKDVGDNQLLVAVSKISNLIENLKLENESTLNSANEGKKEVNNLEEDMEQLKEEYLKLQELNAMKDKDLVTALERNQELERLFQEVQNENENKREELEQALKSNSNTILKAEEDLLKLQQDLINREKEIEVREEAFNNAIDEFNSKQEEFKNKEEELEFNLEECETKNQELEEAAQELESRNLQFSEEAEAKQTELDMYSEDLNKLR